MGRSLAERLAAYDEALEAELERAADEMLEHGGGELPSALAAAGPEVTKVHGQVLDLLEHILELGAQANAATHGQTHPVLGATLRVLRRVAPEARESLARVPEADLKVFLGRLADDINASIDATAACPACGATFVLHGPRPAQPPGA